MLVLQCVNGYNLFICSTNDAGRRLDRVVKKMLPDVPAGLIYSGIRKGLIKVNGKKTKQSYRLVEKDSIAVRESISYAVMDRPEKAEPSKSAQLDRLTVLRTENLLMLNKPAGMLTHGDDSLTDLLESGLTGIEPSLSFKPAPLHRLDRNTSGLIAVSLTISGAVHFSELMRAHRLNKYYLGICLGGPEKQLKMTDSLVRSGLVTKTTGVSKDYDEISKKAVTTAETLIKSNGFALCLFKIETGLTHQIRAQAAAAGFPLAGDSKYGGGTKGFRNYILHSFSISFNEKDEICGFRDCFAQLSANSRSKAESIFGKAAVKSALSDAKRKIIS